MVVQHLHKVYCSGSSPDTATSVVCSLRNNENKTAFIASIVLAVARNFAKVQGPIRIRMDAPKFVV